MAVQETVENGGGDGGAGKNFVPLRENFVRCKNGGGLFVASGDGLKKPVCALNVHGQAAGFVNHEHHVSQEF